jgi:hypothetical protein
MKKLSTLFLVTAMLLSTEAQAQSNMKNPPKAQASDDFNWGIGLGALAVLGTIVGLTVASACSTPPSYSN